MTVNVRTLNGSSDYIKLGAGSNDVGYGTYLTVATFAGSVGAGEVPWLTSISGTTEKVSAWVRFGHLGYYNTHLGITQETTTSLSGWQIFSITKATGSTTPRAHVCTLATPAWTHANMAGSGSDGDAGNGWYIGAHVGFGDFFNGSMYLTAYWNTVLSDGNLETIVGLQSLLDLSPTGLWLLNQASTATAVTEYNGSGADQSSISGTTVTTGVTIPNFLTSAAIVPDTVTRTVTVGGTLSISGGAEEGTAVSNVIGPIEGVPVYPYTDMIPSYDLDNVYNRWTGTRANGSPQTWEDTASQQDYFLRAKQLSSLVSTDGELLNQVQWKTSQFAQPINRIDSLTIMPLVDEIDTERIDAGFAREIGDRITIQETPPGFAAQQSKDYTIQSLGGQVNVGPLTSATLKFGVWPATLLDFWIVGDEEKSLVGETTRPAY